MKSWCLHRGLQIDVAHCCHTQSYSSLVMFSVVRTDVCSKTRACPKVMGTNLELMPYTQPHQTKYLRTACSDASSPVSTSLLTHFPFILNRTQMLAFQHWKKRKAKIPSPPNSKRKALYFWKTPSKGQQIDYFARPSGGKLKRKSSLVHVNSDVHWEVWRWKVLATAEPCLPGKQNQS